MLTLGQKTLLRKSIRLLSDACQNGYKFYSSASPEKKKDMMDDRLRKEDDFNGVFLSLKDGMSNDERTMFGNSLRSCFDVPEQQGELDFQGEIQETTHKSQYELEQEKIKEETDPEPSRPGCFFDPKVMLSDL